MSKLALSVMKFNDSLKSLIENMGLQFMHDVQLLMDCSHLLYQN